MLLNLNPLLLKSIGLSFILGSGLLTSCTNTEKSKPAANESKVCDGERYFFTFKSLPNEPKVEDIDLKAAGVAVVPGTPIMVNQFGPRLNKRLEICASPNNSMTLLSIAEHEGRDKPQVITLDSADTVENLEGLLDGNYENVRIVAFGGGSFGTYIGSAKDAAGNSFLYATMVSKIQDNLTAYWGNWARSVILTTGTLIEGNPYPELGKPKAISPCDASGGGNYVSNPFEIGTAQMVLESCLVRLGGTGSFSFRFLKVSVTDKNPALSSAEQATVSLEGEQLAKNSLSEYNHHNGCDSFWINFGHAQYAVSAANQNSGCGTPVANAPQQPGSINNPLAPALRYKVKYHDQPWSETVADEERFHFIKMPNSIDLGD